MSNILPNGRTADVSKLVVPEWAKQKILEQRVRDYWANLIKEIVYFGA